MAQRYFCAVTCQQRGPGAQFAGRAFEQRRQRFVHRPLFGQPGIHHPLDRLRAVGKIVQRHGAGAALEGIEGAAQHDQALFVRGGAQRGIDKVERLARLGQEQCQQLRRVGGSLHDRHSVLRRRGGRRRRYRVVEHGDRFRARHLGKRHRAEAALLRVEGEALARAGRVMGQQLGKKTQRADILHHVVERFEFLRRLGAVLRQRGHLRAYLLRALRGGRLLQFGQRRVQHSEHRRHAGQRCALLRIGMEAVERVFDRAQRCLDLGGGVLRRGVLPATRLRGRQRIALAVAAAVVIGRRQAVQRKGREQRARRGRAAGRTGHGDEEQGVAQHGVRLRGSALGQAPQLQVDHAEQLLDLHAAGDVAAGHQFGKGLQRQPERARPGLLLGAGHRRHGLGQGGGVFALLRRLRAFQVRQ